MWLFIKHDANKTLNHQNQFWWIGNDRTGYVCAYTQHLKYTQQKPQTQSLYLTGDSPLSFLEGSVYASCSFLKEYEFSGNMKSALKYFCINIDYKIESAAFWAQTSYVLEPCAEYFSLLVWNEVNGVHVLYIMQCLRVVAFRNAPDTLICFYALWWQFVLLVFWFIKCAICVSVDIPCVCFTLITVSSYYSSISICMLTKFPVKVADNLKRIFVTYEK